MSNEPEKAPDGTGSGLRCDIILVGLPGSGKTTVGRLVASELRVPFVDIDEVVASEANRSVTDIFRESGEAHFRRLETAAVRQMLERPGPAVLVPGGGWAAQQGNLEAVVDRCLVVYLLASAEAAAGRLARDSSTPRLRPLIPEGEELSVVSTLLMNRERFYQRADVTVQTDGRPPERVAADVVELARIRGAM